MHTLGHSSREGGRDRGWACIKRVPKSQPVTYSLPTPASGGASEWTDAKGLERTDSYIGFLEVRVHACNKEPSVVWVASPKSPQRGALLHMLFIVNNDVV